MGELLILLSKCILCITISAGVSAMLAYIEIPDPIVKSITA